MGEEQQIIIKLAALKRLIDNKFQNTANISTITVNEFDSFVSSFQDYVKRLRELNSSLYSDFKPEDYFIYEKKFGVNLIGYSTWGLQAISRNIQYVLDISPKETTITPTEMTITTEGIFFAGQYFDAFIKVSELLKNASSEIILIDGYINAQFLQIFTECKDNIQIKILTKARSLTGAVQTAMTSFNQQFATNSIVMEIKSSEDFHDRFLIIDQKDFYHFGASLKDAGNKGFMFSKIEEPSIQQSLLSSFQAKW